MERVDAVVRRHTAEDVDAEEVPGHDLGKIIWLEWYSNSIQNFETDGNPHL